MRFVGHFVCNEHIQEKLGLDQEQLYQVLKEYFFFASQMELKEKLLKAGFGDIIDELFAE
jgi:hypothetical protein